MYSCFINPSDSRDEIYMTTESDRFGASVGVMTIGDSFIMILLSRAFNSIIQYNG